MITLALQGVLSM